MSPVPGIFVVVVSVAISLSHGQSTLIDMDICGNSATFRQITRNLAVLTQQTKSLSLTVQKIDKKADESSKATEIVARMTGEFDKLKTEFLETVGKTMTNIETNTRREVETLNSTFSQQLSELKNVISQEFLNQSAGLYDLFQVIQNASNVEGPDMLGLFQGITTAMNDSMFSPLRLLIESRLSVIQLALNATDGLAEKMRESSSSLEARIVREVGSVNSKFDQVLADTVQRLVSRLSNQAPGTSATAMPRADNSVIDDIVFLIQSYQDSETLATQRVVQNASSSLRESTLAFLSNLEHNLETQISGTNVSGGFDDVRQLIRSTELCPSKAITDTIQAAIHIQTGTLRLVNGTQPTNGRVEVNYKGAWGTICDDGFGTQDAGVICRQLGYCGGAKQGPEAYGPAPSSFPIHLDDLDCTGREANIMMCRSGGLGSHNCNHNEDVGVSCTKC